MKIALCFLTRSNLLQPQVWGRFFAGPAAVQANIYCHPKYPADLSDPLLKPRVIAELAQTRHGHISLVAATLNLFVAAYEDDAQNEYFVLVSESTIPIVPLGGIVADLERCERRSLISYSVPAAGTEHHARLAKVRSKELFASGFYHHDQWVVLHRRHVQLLLERPGLDLFQGVFAADEHYFMNALVHVKRAAVGDIVNRRTTFVNWREREVRRLVAPDTGKVTAQTVHPKTYDRLVTADLAEARAEKHWFFRKVSAVCDCTAVLASIG